MNAILRRVTITRIRELPVMAGSFRGNFRILTINWLVVFGFVAFHPTLLVSPATSLFAQAVATNEPASLENDLENERQDEDFGGDEQHSTERSRELVEIKRDLTSQLLESRDAKTELQACIQSIEALLVLARQRQEYLAAMESARQRADQEAIDLLSTKLKKNNRVTQARDWLFVFQSHEVEFKTQKDEAIRGEDVKLRKLVEVLRDGLREGKVLANQLLEARLGDDELDEFEIEEELDVVFDDRVHAPVRAIELLTEIREAEADDDFDLVDALRDEFRELEDDFDLFSVLDEDEEMGEDCEPSSRPTSSLDLSLQPVVVSDETLVPYAKMDLNRDVAPLLQQYCFDCHSSDASSGELDFEQLLTISPIVKNRRKWINVIEQTKNRVMPPEDADQPTLEERKKIVLALHNAVFNFDYSQISDPGYETARRLTHREYSNTVRDLFGIDIDVTERFPVDLTATSGFDNSGNSLFIQPLLMERYVGLAEYVVAFALPDSPKTTEEKDAHNRIIVARPSETESVSSAAKKVMAQFLLRAFRRPPTTVEVNRFAGRIADAVAAGAAFDDAVKSSLRTVLVSPSFLLRTEQTETNGRETFAVSDYDLASRLSYFLWASMPDDTLLSLAQQGKLAKAGILAQQVKRMLADPKSESLGTVFASQWLGSQHLGTRVRLDPIDNPWCTETLMTAMRQETSMFFNNLVRENRPITELIRADYTFVNEELARLYRMKGVSGTQMRRVIVDPAKRGGILGHGSLLAVTSFPGRTSPVVRGKWILDTVLGTPPPPPPPNVSELSEDIESKRRLSFREKLELHRDKPNCYACHSQMDPLGFSLENFDWFGRYRSKRGRGSIDATGRLPDGTEFEGLAGLKKVIFDQRQDDLIRQVTQKLLSYALGRQLEYYDEPAIRKIILQIGQRENRIGALVREVVLSYPFRYKRNPQPMSASNPTAEKSAMSVTTRSH